MKVYERYPFWMKLYRKRSYANAAYPLRFVLSRLYGLHPSHRARGPLRPRPREGFTRIVSIGNMEWGGAGKTPCVMTLCRALADRGFRPAVVTRGYGSEAERSGPYIVPPKEARIGPDGMRCIEEEGLGRRVVGFGEECTAASLVRLIGDEAALYRSRGVPVVIDKRRKRGAEIAVRIFRPTHLILDDAFQNWDLPRDTDILLLDHERPFGTGELMPLGSLRERPGAARRADIILFTRSRSDLVPPEAAELIEGKPFFFASHRPVRLVGRSGEEIPLDRLEGRRAALVSGIARPETFEATVESLGAKPQVSFRFADHHWYGAGDVCWMLERIDSACTFVTTEKDMVRMGTFFPESVDLVAVAIEMEIRGLDRLLEYIAGGARRSP